MTSGPLPMAICFDRDAVVVPDAVVTRAIEGATVLLHLETGRSFMLDEVGARTWTALTSTPSLRFARAALLEEYDVAAEELEADVAQLIDQLASEGLLEIERG